MPTPANSAGRSRLPGIPRFRRNLWLFILACLLSFIGIGVQGLILNLYFLSLGYREDFLGFYSFANTAGIGAAAFIAGRLANRLGSRRTLIGAIVLFALSSAALVASANLIFLYILGIINGIALAHLFVPTATFVMDNADPEERSSAYAGYFASQAGALVIGSYLGGVLPTLIVRSAVEGREGYAWTLVVAAALTLLGALPLCFADDSKAAQSGATRIDASTVAQQRRQMKRDVRWMIGSNTLVAVSMGIGIPFLNVFFSEKLGAGTAEIGLIFALGSGAMVVASLSGPFLARRLGVVPTIALGRFLTAPVFIALAFATSIPVGAGLYVLRILFTNVTWPVDNAFTMELVRPDYRATLAALRSGSWNLAWAIASGLGGLMIVRFGFFSIFASAAVFAVLGSVMYYVAFRSRLPAQAMTGRSVSPPVIVADG